MSSELIQHYTQLREEVSRVHHELALAQTQLRSKDEEIELFSEELAEKEAKILQLNEELERKENYIESIATHIETVLGSS